MSIGFIGFMQKLYVNIDSLDRVLYVDGLPDAGRGDLAGLPVSFQNVKKP